MTKKVKAVDEKQQQFGSPDDFYLDPYGQMTINKIDSPIGLLCQDVIRAEMEVAKAQEALEAMVKSFMKMMKDKGLKKITVLGARKLFSKLKATNKPLIKGAIWQKDSHPPKNGTILGLGGFQMITNAYGIMYVQNVI